MNFFKHKRQAKSHTTKLLLLFFLSVIGIILAVSLALILTSRLSGFCQFPSIHLGPFLICSFEQELLLYAALGTFAIISLGIIIRHFQFKRNFRYIAQIINGTKVKRDTKDELERRLVNVVEEMAIASGCPVPDIYIMKGDLTFNALAAGYDINHSLVAVTEGLLKAYTRDELQAVMAHEFAHIVNQDIRINQSLMVTIFGISLISLIGLRIISSMRYSMYRSRQRDGRGQFVVIVFGFLIYLIGHIGLLIGRILKSSVSRQREYLADASAVQFTRNPKAMESALKKILGHGDDQFKTADHHEEVAHMFFAHSLTRLKFSLFATHPPLEDRIKRLNPQFDIGKYKKTEEKAIKANINSWHSQDQGMPLAMFGGESTAGPLADVKNLDPLQSKMTEKNLSFTQKLEDDFKAQLRTPETAKSFVLKIFQNDDSLKKFDEQEKILLLELLLSTLRDSMKNPADFLLEVKSIIEKKNKLCLQDYFSFEFIKRFLSNPHKNHRVRKFRRLHNSRDDLAPLVWIVCQNCSFANSALEVFLRKVSWSRESLESPINHQTISDAIKCLQTLREKDLEVFLDALIDLIVADGKISDLEFSFIRYLHLMVDAPL